MSRSDRLADLRRLGGRVVSSPPGDRRDFPSDWYRLPTREEKVRNLPPLSGRARVIGDETQALVDNAARASELPARASAAAQNVRRKVLEEVLRVAVRDAEHLIGDRE